MWQFFIVKHWSKNHESEKLKTLSHPEKSDFYIDADLRKYRKSTSYEILNTLLFLNSWKHYSFDWN